MEDNSTISTNAGQHDSSALTTPVVLLQQIAQGTNPDRAVTGLIANLARSDYSIANLMQDVAELKESIAQRDPTTDGLINGWAALDRGLGQCLAATAASHEKFIARTFHAFCHYDAAGNILSANQKMLDLIPDCIAKPLTDCFKGSRTEVRRAISAGSQRPLEMEMRTRCGLLPVLAEFGRMHTDPDADTGGGGYALLLDMSDRVQAEQKALEAAPFGMLKLDTKHRIVYATEKAQTLLESSLDELIGVDARRILVGDGDYDHKIKVVREAFESRKGHGTDYDLVLTRPKSRTQTHIHVSSIPLFDNMGRVAGSIERLQPTDNAVARETLARLVATESLYDVLYEKIIDVLKPFIEFDWANLIVYSPDRKYSRLVCTYGPEIAFESRWFPTLAGYEDWIERPDTFVDDLTTFDPEALKSPDMQRAVAEGMRALLCLPVRQGGSVIGALCLASRQPGHYNMDSRSTLEVLMIEQALRPVLHLVDRAERDFVNNLAKKIAKFEDLQLLAKCVVQELAEFYKFHNVSMFKVNVLRRRFTLLAQALGTRKAPEMADGYCQPIDDGLLGQCFRLGDYVILSDALDPRSAEAKMYVRPVATGEKADSNVRSELCIPIRLFDRVLWILNIEDERKDAFTIREVEMLKRVIDQIQSILERIFQNTVLAQVLDVCQAGIVLTNQDWKILRCNREASQMLEAVRPNDDLSRYLRVPPEDITSEPLTTKVIGEKGGEVSVQASRFTLDEEYDHMVFLLQDVAELKWSMNFEKIKAALAETAGQVRVPVSLVSTYVRRLSQQVDTKPLRELTRKVMRQLDRIELTYDRVLASYDKDALPASPPRSFQVGVILEHILSDLPSLERKTIAVSGKTDFPVLVDPYRTLFALNSILAYLLRSRSNSEMVEIEVSNARNMVEIAMTGTVRPTSETGDLATLVNTTRAEIGLARNVLVEMAAEAGGEFRSRRSKHRERLCLRIPAADSAE